MISCLELLVRIEVRSVVLLRVVVVNFVVAAIMPYPLFFCIAVIKSPSVSSIFRS